MSKVNDEAASDSTISQRETELLAKIKVLEDDRLKFLDIVRGKIQKLEKELEVKTEENKKLTARSNDLESSLKELGALTSKGKKQSKADDDDLLLRARELLFEKTKICKKQELQLEALNNQLDATKDVLDITKDMLNLRNIESDHQQSRMDGMTLKLRAERDQRILMQKRLDAGKQTESALRKEYEVQSGIFKDLRSTYECKINILIKQLEVARTPVT